MADAPIPPLAGRNVRYTLDKSMKLRFRSQFETLKREGRTFTGRPLLVVLLPAERTACGVICSKKYSLLSVERNRARRMLWESFRLLRPHLLQPCQMLLIARRSLRRLTRPQTTREIAALLLKAGILDEATAASPPES